MNTNLRGYGDVSKAKLDGRALMDLIQRQGTNFVIDVIAEHIGETVLKYGLNEADVKRLKDSLVTELVESINERT